MKYAVAEGGKVKNIVVCNDAALAASNGWISTAEVEVKIGDTWNGSEFISESIHEPVPVSVTKFQAKAALLSAGLLSLFEEYIADPATAEIIKLAWLEAPDFNRSSPTILAVTEVIGLTSEQVDDLFIAAKKVNV